MTNQEAIEHIKNIEIYSYQDGYTDEAREALDMAISALREQDLQPTCNQLATDTISRQAAIDAFYQYPNINWTTLDVLKKINDLASAQPDGIPLEWIDKHLEWLDNCDNDFAQLAKVSIRAMVEIWKKDKI